MTIFEVKSNQNIMKFLFTSALIFLGLFIKAQQQDLINHTWFLYKVVLDSNEHLVPNTSDEIIAQADFSENQLQSFVCNTLGGDISNLSNEEVDFSGLDLTLITCPSNFDEYNLLENNYFGLFFGANTATGFYENFSYTIQDLGSYLQLTLVNPVGDSAIYYSQYMSVYEINNSKISLYPNPVKDVLYIDGFDDDTYRLELYNSSGKQVENRSIPLKKHTELAVNHLQKGLYIINIRNRKGVFLYQSKILKE